MSLLKYAILTGGLIKIVSAATKKITFRLFHRHEILKNDKLLNHFILINDLKKFTNPSKGKTLIGFPFISGKLGFSIPILLNEEDFEKNYQRISKQNIFCFLDKSSFQILNEDREFDFLIKNTRDNSQEFPATGFS